MTDILILYELLKIHETLTKTKESQQKCLILVNLYLTHQNKV